MSIGIDIRNNPIIGEELACESENMGNTWGTTTSESRAIFFTPNKKFWSVKF